MIPFRPLGDRVVIQADIEDHAPTQTESGLLLAKSLAAAVDGSDTEDSWFVGTIVALGPLVNRFEIRPYVLKRLYELTRDTHCFDDYHVDWIDVRGVCDLMSELKALPAECPDPLQIGDRVAFSWAAGQQITVDGVKYLILKQSEVLAVLDPESEAA